MPSPRPGSWNLIRSLGLGGMGEVYLALDPDGREVAVKTLRAPKQENRGVFEQEAKLLTRLQHPAIPRVRGYLNHSAPIFGEERGPCFWMDYVVGRSVLDAARGASPAQIFSWLESALEALQYLQAHSIAHGDLSPGNLLLTEEGQIKLIDFGMAGEFSEALPKNAGTLPYLAPERLEGKNFPSSELFALGVIFYEALAGKHPRAGAQSLAELLSRKAPPLLESAPTLEAGFAIPARLVDRLVELDPTRRLASAEEALETLQGGAPSAAFSPGPLYHPLRMFGAEALAEQVRAALRRLEVRSTCLLVHGLSGVGKTRFLNELTLEGAMTGIEFQEVSIREVQKRISEMSAREDSTSVVFRLCDLQLAPLSELQLLLGLKRAGLPPRNCFLVLEWNDELLPDSSRRLLDLLRAMPEAIDVELGPLQPAIARRWIVEALGEGAGAAVQAGLLELTGGNPQMLLETIHLLQERRVAAKRHFSREWLEELGRLHSFDDILAHRLRNLPEEEKRILAYLAAAEAAPAFDSLAEALDRGSASKRIGWRELRERLRSLCARNLLRQTPGDCFALFLPALRAAALAKEGPATRARIHRDWLAVLPATEEHAASRLRHALALEDREAIAALALPGVEAAVASQNKSEALNLAAATQGFLEAPIDRSRLLRIQANLLIEADRYEEALEVAERAFGLAAEDEDMALKTAKYLLATGILLQNLGRLGVAKERFTRCLALVGPQANGDLQPYRVRALGLLGMAQLEEGQTAKALEFFGEAMASPTAAGARRAELCRNMAAALAKQGQWEESRGSLEEARRLYGEAGHRAGEYASWLQEGNLALEACNPDLAASCYRKAEGLALELKDELYLARVWNNLAVLARRRLELAPALAWFRQALEILRTLGNPQDLAGCLEQAVRAEAAAGRFAAASGLIGELKELEAQHSSARGHRQKAEAFLESYRDGSPVFDDEAEEWSLESRLHRLAHSGAGGELKLLLLEVETQLPPFLQVSFAERHDYRNWVAAKAGPPPSLLERKSSMEILKDLSAINRGLLLEEDMDRVLESLMAAALRLSKAENGFLLLRNESNEGPVPGFSVVVAQNVDKRVLESAEFAFSLSAVRRAMDSGQAVVTDNALQDARFNQAKSVQLHELKSILALPVMGSNGVLGAFYLDHRFEAGLFGEDVLALMQAFSDQAALALLKARMIEDLKKANRGLVGQVEEQSDQLHLMQMELAESRLKLKHEYSEIIGRSPGMLETLSLVDKITDSKIAVWIFGESGTGKESIARALHFNSARAKYPFVSENCSALPETLMESELFGHKKGAFTHADRDKKGILAYADKGTIFLDEIADLSLSLQAKLLRFLQEGEIRPLGGNETIRVDVRVVSASNKDLEELVRQGKFREDLYFRLNGVTVSLPPLRERKEDLPLLAEHFLKKMARREGKEPCRLGIEAMRQFMNYPWPGNIRELQNSLETAALFADQGVIGLKALAFKPVLLASKKSMKSLAMKSMAKEALDPELEKILLAIRDHGYHKGNAAKALGISRRNLYTKLEKFGISVELKDLKAYIDATFI